jgi:hypothetical protein
MGWFRPQFPRTLCISVHALPAENLMFLPGDASAWRGWVRRSGAGTTEDDGHVAFDRQASLPKGLDHPRGG